MSRRKRHNPEKQNYKGKSYKKGGKRIRNLKDKQPLENKGRIVP